MKPVTQNVLLAVLAVVSIGTTGLVLLKGAIENASYEPQKQADADGAGHGHNHQHHSSPAAIVKDAKAGELDNFGPAPAFTLVNQDGVPATLDTFKGKAVIASFIFTRCSGPCPMISSQMAALSYKLAQGPYSDRVALVSFSVDPEHDTPPVLKEYAQRFEANTTRWSFLTGSRKDIWQLVGKGFKLALMDQPDDKESPILHTTKLVLIDPQGQVRGYYDALNEESRAVLDSHLKQVMAEKPAASHTDHTGHAEHDHAAGDQHP